MVQIVPPHTPLESPEDQRDAVRRRAAPTATSVATVTCVVLAVGLFTYPVLLSAAFATFGVGLVVGHRL
jgi:hypothetical protein